jgi:DNA-binding transcriptional ArsR family regulator
LDKRTFEALAMESRIKILKALKERRKTQSELSKELSLAPSTVSEHLEKMLDAGLIARKKDHHKWIYYELTEKGQHILSPQKASVFVFALSMTLFLVFIGYMFVTFTTGSFRAASAPMYDKALGAGSPEAMPLASQVMTQPDYVTPAVLIAIVIVAALLLLWRFKRMRKHRTVQD